MKQQQECNILDIFKEIWIRKYFICIITVICCCIGFLISQFIEKKYVATGHIEVSYTTNPQRISIVELSSLNPTLECLKENEHPNLKIYNSILHSDSLINDLYLSKININNLTDSTTLKEELFMHYPQWDINRIKENIILEQDSESEDLFLTITFPNSSLATQIVNNSRKLLQKYTTQWLYENRLSNYEFLKKQCQIVQTNLQSKQELLLQLQTKQNQDIANQAKKQIALQEYEVYSKMYTNLIEEFEKAKMKIADKHNILEITNISIPVYEKSASKLIVVLSFMLGLCISIGWVLIRSALFSNTPQE